MSRLLDPRSSISTFQKYPHKGGADMENRGIEQGMVVRSSDGEKLGKVVQCAESFFLIEKGFFFPKDYLARYEQISEIRDGEVRLDATAASLQEAGDSAYETERTERTTLEGGAAGLSSGSSTETRHEGLSAGTREELRVPLAEEELTAEKRMREAGEVRVRKEVVTEHKQISVPVTREEVHVERVPASGSSEASAQSFQEGTVSVPIREEEVEIRKRPVIREEVRVTKTRRQEERRADAEVRREEAHIEGDNVDRTDRTDRTDEPGILRDPKE
jgi:uncharacterized protein (TIGR02271 family)